MTRQDDSSPGAPQSPRQDAYEAAREVAVERLRANWDRTRLQGLGLRFKEPGKMELDCLAWQFALDEETLVARLLPDGQELAIAWQILVLEYLAAPVLAAPEKMLSLADFGEARGYARPFEGRVLRRLSSSVGRGRECFIRAAESCGGVRVGDEPLQYRFRFFPRFELEIVRHEGDDEFLPACNVLFPDHLPALVSIEGAIVAAEKLVSSLNGKEPTK